MAAGYTCIDLFCGAGGMTLGFTSAGFSPLFALDNNPWAVATYNRNFGAHAICADIQKVREFPSAQVIVGGPPCQGFSLLGERLPSDPRNQLWRGYMRAAAQVKPLVFVMENVPQLLSSEEYREIVRQAERLGYEIEGRVLNAADYGVPQTRKRAIIIASRIGPVEYPKPTHSGHRPWRTVRDAVGDLPLEPETEGLHQGRNPRPKSLARYKSIPEGGNRWDMPRRLQPQCWIKKTKGGTDLMGRLWWDRPAFTIRTEFFKPEKGRYLHPQAHRPITHREAARFQTFPDDFVFEGSKIEIAKQIGNAVPCLMAEAIAKTVRRMLQRHEHRNGHETKAMPRRRRAYVAVGG